MQFPEAPEHLSGDLLLTWDPEVYTLAVARGEITYEYWSTGI